MRRPLLFLAVLLLALPAAAQLRGPTNQILIPAAGAVQGANGTFFRSDITLTNFRNAAQQVQLRWLPETSGTTAPPQITATITLPANSGVSSEDFVTNYLNQTGLGSILITGVTSTGAVDTGALLFATDRIWSNQPGTSGTVSQTFPIVPVGALNPAAQVIVLGQKINSQYRSNVGLVNLDPNFPRTFDIAQSTEAANPVATTMTVTVAPMSMLQVPLLNSPASALQVIVSPRVDAVPSPGYNNQWVAYVSSVDNVTGDSWSNLAMPLLQ